MTESEWLVCDDPARMLRAIQNPAHWFAVGSTAQERGSRASERKLRLFACACYVGIFVNNLDLQPVAAAIVGAVERWADGEISRDEAVAVQPPDHSHPESRRDWYLFGEDAGRVVQNILGLHSQYSNEYRADLLREIVGNPFDPVRLGRECTRCNGKGHVKTYRRENREFGGTEVVADSSYCKGCLGEGRVGKRDWITADVLRLANDAYDSRDFSSLPILADALEDAGCDDRRILDHLRGGACDFCGGSGRTLSVKAIHPNGSVEQARETDCMVCGGSGRRTGTHVRGCHVLDVLTGRS